MFDDYKNFWGYDPTEKMRSKEAEDYNNSVRALKDEFKKKKPEYVKELLQSEFNQQVKNVHFNLVTDGRTKRKTS